MSAGGRIDSNPHEFLMLLAHELRNPLAPIRHAMQVMHTAEGDFATMSAARSIVERQLRHLTRLIDDLLDISLASDGKLVLQREFVELDSLVAEALAMVRPQLEGKQQIIRVDLGTTPLVLHADPARSAHVLANVLDNASKYSALSSLILISAHRAGDAAVVTVSDQGAGIPPDMLDRVFDMFQKVRTPGNDVAPGLGIGLTLVKQIVELHGGSVRAQSAGPGRGTQIVLQLPIAANLQPAGPAVGSSAVSSAPIRILIADDNRDAAQALAMMLRLEGHEVRTVHEGAEAIKAGAAFRPQLVLLDIGMPGLDGYATARQIAKEPWGGRAYLVALTGWSDDEARRKAVEAGFQEHLVKPAELALLKDAIERARRNDF